MFGPKSTQKTDRLLVLTGFAAGLALCAGEFLSDAWFGLHFPGYDWRINSISYLGESGSPVSAQVSIWGNIFSVLCVLFALGFYRAFPNRSGLTVAILLAIYGLCEGVGSGIFPINPIGTPRTAAAFWHDVMGAVGDSALVLLPAVVWKVFPAWRSPAFSRYILSVIGLGIVLATLFLLSKFMQPATGILVYRGFWQRLYMANYFVFLTYLAFAIRIYRAKPGDAA